MGIYRRTKHLAAWIACLAILMASLMPSLSHAIAGKSGTGSVWTEICTAAGLATVKVSVDQADDSSQQSQHDLHFEDCPYCHNQPYSSILPAADRILVTTLASFPLPSLFYQAPRPLFIWASARSRAPPLS